MSRDAVQHVLGFLDFLNQADGNGGHDQLTTVGCVYGLLGYFAQNIEDPQILSRLNEHFAQQFEEAGVILPELLEHHFTLADSILQPLSSPRSKPVCNEDDDDDVDIYGECEEEVVRPLPVRLQSRRESHDVGRPPPLDPFDLAKLHAFFYGCIRPCENLLDVLAIEMQVCYDLSWIHEESLGWWPLLAVVSAEHVPFFDLTVNSSNLRLLSNWCKLVEFVSDGTVALMDRVDVASCLIECERGIDFVLDHSDAFLQLAETLELALAETTTEGLFVAIETVKPLIVKLVFGAVEIYSSILFYIQSDSIKEKCHDRVINVVRRAIATMEIDVQLLTLERLLKSLSRNQPLHDSSECSNYFKFDVFSEIFWSLKSDRANWTSFHAICLDSMPTGFCSCVSPMLLLNRLFLPVNGKDLLVYNRLCSLHFDRRRVASFPIVSKLELDKWKVDMALDIWLTDSMVDGLNVLDVIGKTLPVFDDESKRSIVASVLTHYDQFVHDRVRRRALKLMLEHIEAVDWNKLVCSVLLSQFPTFLLDPLFRSLVEPLVCTALQWCNTSVATQLIEAVTAEFACLLKRAIVDVWSFLHPVAERYYHGLCDLLQIFRVVLEFEILTDHARARFLTDCNRLGNVCVDALEFPSEKQALNEKLATLIALLTYCLGVDEKSFSHLSDKFMATTVEATTSTVTLATSFLREARKWRSLSRSIKGRSLEDGSESDDEGSLEFTVEPELSLSRDHTTPIEENIALLGVKLVKVSLSKMDSIDDAVILKLRQFLSLLDPALFDDEGGGFQKATNLLFEASESVTRLTSFRPSLRAELLCKTAEFVARKPCPKALCRFLPNAFNGSELMSDIAVAFYRLLEHRAVEPAECLQLPQKPFAPSERPDPAALPSRLFPAAAACFVLDPVHKIFLAEGMTLSFWLSVARFSTKRAEEHLVSIGTPQLHASVFIQATSGSLTLTVSSFGVIIRRFKVTKLFDGPKKWENVCIGLKCFDGLTHLTVLFGDRMMTTVVDADAATNTAAPFEVGIGSAMDTDFLYEISSIFAFKDVISPECAIAVRSLGCEFQCLTECRSGEVFASFTSSMTKNLIADQTCRLLEVWSEPRKYVSKLQRSVVFFLQSTSAHCYGLSILQKGIDSEKMSRLKDGVLCLTMYKDFPIEWHCPIVYRKHPTLDISLHAIGSVKLFVFLYSLSVDKSYDAKAQLACLRLLFFALRRSPTYYGEFRSAHGLHVLTQVMNTNTAHLTKEIFDELASFLFSELERNADGCLEVSFYTTITEPEFLKTLVSTTDLWKRDYFEFWAGLMKLTAASIDTCKVKFFEYNSKILHRVDFLNPLLHSLLDMQQHPNQFCCPESVDEDGDDVLPSASRELVSSVCAVVTELISSPFRAPAVINLWNYISLSHSAQDTYLDSSLHSHDEWIRPDDIDYKKVLMNFDKDKIGDLWRKSNSVSTVRKEILKTDSDYRIFAPSSLRMDSMGCGRPHDSRDAMNGPHGNDTMEGLDCSGHWLITLRSDLLSAMCNIVLSCEDSLMSMIEIDVVTWKTIIVQLTNQPHPRIRVQVFLLLQNFFLRCDEKYRDEFSKQHGFLLLASQLRKYPVNYQITDALFSIFCGECVKVKDGLDEEHLSSIDATAFRYASFHALFALLEASVGNYALFWTVCSTLQKIFEANQLLRRAMVDCGIVDSMINVLRLLCAQQTSVKTMIGPVFPLLDCWTSFSRSIISLVIPYHDPYMYARAEDFIWLCHIADQQLSSVPIEAVNENEEPVRKMSKFAASVPSHCIDCARTMVRGVLCQLLQCWFDSIQSVLSDGSALIPVDERLEEDETDSDDSAFEICYADSQFTSSSHFGEPGRSDRRKRLDFAKIEELSRRLCFALQMANELFIFGQIPELITEKEECCFVSYVDLLMAPWRRRTSDMTEDWYNVIVSSKDKSRVLFAQLIAYVLFPVQVRQLQILRNGDVVPMIDTEGFFRRRLLIIRILTESLSNKNCLSSLLEVNLDYQYAMKIALHELALCPQYSDIWEEYSDDLERLIKFLRTIQLESPLANLTRDEVKSLNNDEIILMHTYSEKKHAFMSQLRANAQRLVDKDKSLIKAVGDTAMVLTCNIAELHNEPRKFYIQCRKTAINASAKANEVLANLVVELCHPEAPLFDVSSWPRGWSLDTTENLRRERKRLKPDHYRFEQRFLRKERQKEINGSTDAPAPLQLLRESCPNYATTDYIEASNQVRLSLSATLIRTAFECSGEIIISDRKIHFLGEEARSTQKGAKCNPVTFAWSYQQLSEICNRYFLLKDTALELFTTTGDAFLVVFANTTDRTNFSDQLKRMNMERLFPNESAQLKVINTMWRHGRVTNFDYLMTLNKLAGRSFNDLMQYPVFPFTLANYASSVLDLTNSTNFRDLSRPMAVQNRAMEDVYIHNYNSLQEEVDRKKAHELTFSSACFGAYHYGSHYSNTGIVAHYLVRLSPFTNVALEYQDNNFDIPDRLFNSMDTAWRLSSSESTTDFKELIPEFYFLPEILQNRDRLDLGVKQAGIEVDHVHLPPWCPSNNARLFCLIHRQVLECQHVTNMIHRWIDLIFGFKQNGPAAVKAINVFHPATYRGKNLEGQGNHDEILSSALKTMVKTYGQMPNQLFLSPHLPHLSQNKAISTEAIATSLLSTVKGLRWGSFVGSPEMDQRQWMNPVLNLNLSGHDSIGRLVALHREPVCYGLPDKTELVIGFEIDVKDALRRAIEIKMTAVVSWRFNDNMLRIKVIQLNDSVWVNLIDLQMFEPTQVVFSPNTELLFIGTTSGLVRAYSLEYRYETKIWTVRLVNEFFAHKAAISCLRVCDDFHIMLTTSVDGKACLWDSNQLTFIRTLVSSACDVEETITFTAISPISADIAIVYQSGRGSRLVLYTVNGDIIGTYATGPAVTISSIAMTNMEEGTGINCIAIGLQDGTIRLLESWTLTLVSEISVGSSDPVISIEFTNEARRLYAALANGRVLCWQIAIPTAAPMPGQAASFEKKNKNPNFRVINPFE